MIRKAVLAVAPLLLLAVFSGCAKKKPVLAVPTVNDYSYADLASVAVKHMELELDIDFSRRVFAGTATFDLDHRAQATTVHFDTWALNILDVTVDGKEAHWALGDSVELLGRPLSVAITPSSKQVSIRYETSPDARGVQWLEPAQTAGKKEPYVYTQSQAIHARSWVPCQDTPANRFTYNARVHVSNGLLVLMSAANPRERSADGTYTFAMPDPLPSYLLALAAGDIEYRSTGARTGVYSEPSVVDAAAFEFSDLERMMEAAEALYGPYRWSQYDVLVLPPSFPYGGMENPRLTFATPTLLAGDRSLVSVICHELAHSWSGNLVTNATWNDFWLNEGFTTYFERRMGEALYGREFSEMQTFLGIRDLESEFEEKGADNKDTALYVDLAGRDPDEVPQMTPYEKGYLFLRLLEESFGRETFDGFLRRYFDAHAFQTMTTEKFVTYLKTELFAGNEARWNELMMEQWIYAPGLPSNSPRPVSARFDAIDAQIKRFAGGARAAMLKTQGWTVPEWERFIDNLPAPLSAAAIEDLEKTFRFSEKNAYIQRAWYQQVIASNYQPLYPSIEVFLHSIGRGYLLRPVYVKLAETPDGLAFARKVYAGARPGYHAVTRSRIDLALKWDEVAN